MDLDGTDEAILRELRRNARLSMRDLATRVHMSPPAVTERVRRLEEAGVIVGYTAVVDRSRLAPIMTAWVHVFLKGADAHSRFLRFVQEREEIRECHRISGESCYLLKVEVTQRQGLAGFLDALLSHGNYRLHTVLSSRIKE